jgi:hypothetical protein
LQSGFGLRLLFAAVVLLSLNATPGRRHRAFAT